MVIKSPLNFKFCIVLNLDNLLRKYVIVLFFWKSNFKMALIWKKGYFWPTFHIF